jgi:endonuclease/exonuclease/phosphatase family metal-dependent hydrolase
MRIRIVTWNMNYCFRRHQTQAAWQFLRSLEPDIALLQEAPHPPDAEKGAWQEAVKGWGTAIVVRSGFGFEEVPSVTLGGEERIPRPPFCYSRNVTILGTRP